VPDAVARHVQRCPGTSFQELAAFCKQPHDGGCPLFPETEEGTGNNTSLTPNPNCGHARSTGSNSSLAIQRILVAPGYFLGAKTSRYGSQSNLGLRVILWIHL
jgi:hypothetical protein